MQTQPTGNRCPNCGATMAQGLHPYNCTYCGVQQTATLGAPQPTAPNQPAPQKIKTNMGWYFLVMSIAAIIAASVQKDGTMYLICTTIWFVFIAVFWGSVIWFIIRKARTWL